MAVRSMVVSYLVLVCINEVGSFATMLRRRAGCPPWLPRPGSTTAATLGTARYASLPVQRLFSRVGDVAHAVRTYTQEDVAAFARLTHDDNPIHGDDDFASSARYGRPIVHGMLYATMFGAIVGQR